MEAPAQSRPTRRSAGRLTFTQRPAIIELAALTGTCQSSGLRRMRTLQVNSVPLSETIMPGLPRRSISAVSSRATRSPEIEMSGIAARHSRVTSSTMFRIRKRRPLTIGELVMDKIQRPAGVRPSLDQDRRPGADRAAANPAFAHAECAFRGIVSTDFSAS